MTQEIPKLQTLEDGTDLYDGMILSALEDPSYDLDTLDLFALQEISKRVEEYLDVVNDVDIEKSQQLDRHMGRHMNKVSLKYLYEQIKFIMRGKESDLDRYDATIIAALDNPSLLDQLATIDLEVIKRRLVAYYAVLDVDIEEEKEKLFDKLGHYLAKDSVHDLLEYVEELIFTN